MRRGETAYVRRLSRSPAASPLRATGQEGRRRAPCCARPKSRYSLAARRACLDCGLSNPRRPRPPEAGTPLLSRRRQHRAKRLPRASGRRHPPAAHRSPGGYRARVWRAPEVLSAGRRDARRDKVRPSGLRHRFRSALRPAASICALRARQPRVAPPRSGSAVPAHRDVPAPVSHWEKAGCPSRHPRARAPVRKAVRKSHFWRRRSRLSVRQCRRRL